MPVCVELLKNNKYCIMVREWASSRLQKKIKSVYNSKSNAIRAVRDEKRNLVTMLCQLAYENAQHVADLEKIIRDLKQKNNYARSTFKDAGSIDGGDSDSTGVDSGAFSGDTGAETGDGTAE